VATSERLANRDTSPGADTSLSGEGFDEADLASIVSTSNFNQTAYYHIAKLRLAYLAGEPEAACRWARHAEALLPSFAGQPGQGELAVLGALARLAALPDSQPARSEALGMVRETLAQLDAWENACPANFAPKSALVRGELAARGDNPDAADRTFEAALNAAAVHGAVQWAAITAERRGHLALRSNPELASSHFVQAAASYRAWGANRKADELEALARVSVTDR
jgi:hypothetical protein